MSLGDVPAMNPRFDYIREPPAIYERSFELVRAAIDLSGVPADLHAVALRIVHACGQPEVIRHLRASNGAGEIGRGALAGGALVLADTRMTADGIGRLPAGGRILCTLDLAEARRGMTRTAAAVERWPPWLAGAVVAIGNAPTALFRLLEGLGSGWPRPALVLGFPVGFVGAAEAKAALADSDLPHITLEGRSGGSAMAAAAVNALAGGAP
ncbi:MAG: precorrin-8X methylmutase [Alphaproteobacteria bacterium]